MKKIPIIFCLVALSISAFAQQPKKGVMLAGGGVSFNVYKITVTDIFGYSNDTNYANLGINPRFGYAIINGLIVGGILNLTTGRAAYTGYKSTNVGVAGGPFARYYLPFGLFGEASFTGGALVGKTESGGVSSPKQTSTVSNLFLGAGFAYFLTSSVSLEPIIGFGRDRTEFDDNSVQKNRGLRVNVTLVVYLRNE